jgi:hypothetical protein
MVYGNRLKNRLVLGLGSSGDKQATSQKTTLGGVKTMNKTEKAAPTPQQRELQAYLLNSLAHYRTELTRKSLLVAFAQMPFQVAFMAFLVYWLLFALHLTLNWLSGFLGDWMNYGLYLVPLIIVPICIIARFAAEDSGVSLNKRRDWLPERPDRVALNPFDFIFNTAAQAAYATLFLTNFLCQVAILRWTPNHGGLAITSDLRESILLTFDNLCHGVFFDTFELYAIRIAPAFQHTNFSATVFWLFRLAFDGMAIIFIYDLYLKYRYRRFLDGSPGPSSTPAELATWIEQLCADRRAWPRHFCDTFLFLYLVAKYIRGEYDLIRLLGRNSQWLEVSRDLRELFVDPDGHYLLIWE